MSAYKHLSDLLKICSVLPALVIMPAMADTAQYTNPADVENWSGNKYETTDSGRTGGVLNVAGGDKIDEIKAGNVKDNSITLTKTDGYDGEVFGQGSVLYNKGIIGKITGTFENNSITNTSATASKATANGGAFALYAGTNIGSIQADFIGNSVTAQYSGGGTTSYTGNSQISAGGGAMHIQGAFGDDEVIIGTISGDFTGNSANGDEYANGGAIYIKGGASDRDISDKYAVHIGKIEGDFTDNKVIAATNTTKNKKNSTGGAISVKVDADAGKNGDVVIDEIVGDFANNSVQTNTTDALGGAIYNEGTVNVTGDFSKNMATATTTKGNGRGGAIYNVGTMNVSGTFNGNSANNQGGAIWNSGDLTIADGSVFSENTSGTYGGAIATRIGASADNSSLTLSNSLFSKNHADVYGGALYNTVKTTVADGTSFTDNTAGFGGAIWNEGELNFTNTAQITFGKNISTGAGGAIYNKGTIDKLTHVLFQYNEAAQGGAINNSNLVGENQGGYIGEIAHATFANNDAGNSQGGAIRNQGKIGAINEVLFSANTSGNGGAFNNGTWGSVVESMTGVDFVSNTAIAEDGLGQGGAIANAGGIALIADSNFSGNQAGKIGGAIANVNPEDDDSSKQQHIKLQDVKFTSNVAGQHGGAIYNDTHGIIELGGTNTFSGNTADGVGNDIHNLGTITIADGETTISGGITGTGTLTVADGAVLDIGTSTLQQGALDMQGTLVAAIVNSDAFGKFDVDDFTIGDNAKLDLTLGAVGTYDLGIDIDLEQITYNDTIYQVSVDGSDIIVGTKSVQDVAKDTNLTTNSAAVLVGLMNSDNYSMNIASLNAQSALASGDTEYVENESKKMLPHDTPIAQSVATSVQNQVLSVAANRMSGASMIGRSGGDLSQADYGIWAQGLINRAKYADKFTGDTKGISVGADALVDGKYTIGIGYAHNETDVDATRDTDISSDSIFVYGQYKPTHWYINAALNYTMANYTEEVSAFGINAGAEYDVNSFGGQVMTGYDFATGLTPEVGVRYLHISQDDYNNGLADISGSDTDYLTGIAGVKYAFTIESDARLKFRPELRAAATYDFMSDVMTTTIDMPGVASYVLDGERLSRFGGEFGIGLTALYNGWEISVNYDLDLHEHYTSQTGMLKFRYNF